MNTPENPHLVVNAGRVVLPTAALQEDWRMAMLDIQNAQADSARDRALHFADGWANALLSAKVITEPTYVALIACNEDTYANAKAVPASAQP
ncbi:hypothetical protein ACEN2T_17265 [Pseudomonas sp. W22_MBD1_FP4]|uniref:hypothetical protein n=1 Tax=Pseudomonas sp. W22_MBD1_FP4 TaxID=3240272 RepID=UPI003F9A04B7